MAEVAWKHGLRTGLCEQIYNNYWLLYCMFRLQRLVKDLLKQLQGQDSGQWANNKVSGLDRTLGEISRILEKQVQQQMDHIDTVANVIVSYLHLFLLL